MNPFKSEWRVCRRCEGLFTSNVLCMRKHRHSSHTHTHTVHKPHTHLYLYMHTHTSCPVRWGLWLSAGCDRRLRLRTEPRSAVTLRTHDWTWSTINGAKIRLHHAVFVNHLLWYLMSCQIYSHVSNISSNTPDNTSQIIRTHKNII